MPDSTLPPGRRSEAVELLAKSIILFVIVILSLFPGGALSRLTTGGATMLDLFAIAAPSILAIALIALEFQGMRRRRLGVQFRDGSLVIYGVRHSPTEIRRLILGERLVWVEFQGMQRKRIARRSDFADLEAILVELRAAGVEVSTQSEHTPPV